ncbi:unnamed protein product [Mesocestoides corti]|uniref:WW domain-containing protein n=1 Tax=Mesocestoides corti TaxID=53468 RepID=A0A158QUY5_MESCO|nr:unnamed protein product [Mesocestoides corti]
MSVVYVDPIPEGWEMRLDDATQTYYFIDHNNQVTQWQHPINKLVYRPSNRRELPNGVQSTPITINRQNTSDSEVKTGHYQPQKLSGATSSGTDALSYVKNETPLEDISRTSELDEQCGKKNEDTSIISKVLEKAAPVIKEVNSFNGIAGDKEYLRLMETLEVLILELDGIGVDGQDSVRTARRAAVREIQQAIEMLEFRGSINSSRDPTGSQEPAVVESLPPSEDGS